MSDFFNFSQSETLKQNKMQRSYTFGFIEKMEIIFIDWYVTKDKFLIKFYGEDTIDIIKIAEYDKQILDLQALINYQKTEQQKVGEEFKPIIKRLTEIEVQEKDKADSNK